MPYTHFRYIAYELPTATIVGGSVVSGYPPGTNCPVVPEIPVPSGLTLTPDAEARLLRFAAVVKRAWERVQALGGDNGNALKIFMAPEFYFRPPSTTGGNYKNDSYPSKEAAKIIAAFDTMFEHVHFTDWLIIPGTLLWNNEDVPLMDGNFIYRNTALRIKGGAANSTHLIEKNMSSGIDGVPAAYTTGGYTNLKLVYQDWALRQTRSFNIEGIDFGLDICLDHLDDIACKQCKNVLREWAEKGSEKDTKIHLLTAGGMTIQEKSVAANVKGYILRNDGYSNAPVSQQKRVTKYDYPKYIGIGTFSPKNLGSTAVMDADTLAQDTINLAGVECVPPKPAQTFAFAQRIVIYPTTAF
ncbi:MAG: hypothetical protein JKY09_07810 [Crocinitomicaceae bacterium]|nr:hypothetical protein [Crocinitomicaceae bacterium]